MLYVRIENLDALITFISDARNIPVGSGTDCGRSGRPAADASC